MLKISINPSLKIFQFDGGAGCIAEIECALKVVIKRQKPFSGDFTLTKQLAPTAADAAEGWGGWVVSQKLEIGDFIAAYDKGIQILKAKEFHRFFVIEK